VKNVTSFRGGLLVAAAGFLAGCATTPAPTEQEIRRRESARAVDAAVREILRDDAAYAVHAHAIRSRFVGRAEEYVDSVLIQEDRVRVDVARSRLQKALQEEGILRLAPMRAILVLRRGAGVDAGADAHLDDLAEGLSRELAERGFRPKLWSDVRLSVALRRDMGDRDLDRMLARYVEESDWRRPADERYELPLLLLRTEGRLLVGFKIVELKRIDLAYHVTLRADSYDLLNGQSLGFDVLSGRRAIGNDSLVATRQRLVADLSKKLMHEHATRLVDFLERERRRDRDRKDYALYFEGYADVERARIESLLAGIVAEDIEMANDGKTLAARARIARDPIPLRDDVARTLALVGLKSRLPLVSASKFTFVKE
jgi:hypothetical protein